MNTLEQKKQILQVVHEEKQKLYEDIRDDAKELLNSANTDDELGLQNQMESKREEMMEDYEREAKQLDHMRQELEVLEQISDIQIHEEVEIGSAVMTDQLNFFVAVTHHEFEVEGQKFMGISTEAPIYQAMKGLKKDQTFTFNNKTFKILNIF